MKSAVFSLCCFLLSGILTLKGADADAGAKEKSPLDGWHYVERVGGDLTLVLKSTSEPYNVLIISPALTPGSPGKKRGCFVEGKAGAPFGLERDPDQKRFEFKEFRLHVVQDPVLGEKNRSLMIVYDRVLKENLDLFLNMPVKVPDSKAKLQCHNADSPSAFEAPLHDIVHLGDGNGPAYQIVDIQEDLVIFSPVKADGAVDDKVKLVLNKEPDSVPQPPAGDRLPLGIPIAGMPGYVSSPYLPNASIIDLRDVPPGTKVRDPYTGKVFLVP